MAVDPISALPADIASAANLQGNEYGWPPQMIPEVIEAARKARLLNLGGQLQFRAPEGACECYWVNADDGFGVDQSLPWPERVERTAKVSLERFTELQSSVDFIAEGVKGFTVLKTLQGKGMDIGKFACFVWYLESNESSGAQA